MSKALKVIVAAAAGVLAGVLFAPKSGKETRQDIQKKADKLKGQADAELKEVKRVAKKSAGTIKTGAKEVSEEVKEFSDDVKKSAKIVAGQAKVTGKKVATTATKTAAAVKGDVKKKTTK